jgi:hypothetical protein
MPRARALGLSVVLPFVLLGCRMDNPAFEDDDELGDDVDDESTRGESTQSDAAESGSAEGTEDSTDTSTSDDATSTSTSTSDDATSTSTSTSDDETTETTDTSESETGLICGEGLMDCEGVCVDIDSHPLNCGSCGMACADNELCVGSCSPKKYVFVSSELRTGGMGGILGADNLCSTLADEAGLPGDYLAWNSTNSDYPNLDFVKEGVYVRTDGQIVATSYADLVDGNILHPIDLDESQLPALNVPFMANCEAVTGPVWSNTTSIGDFAGGLACGSWFNGTNLSSGRIGSVFATDGRWTNIDDCYVPCGAWLPIYCVQQNP